MQSTRNVSVFHLESGLYEQYKRSLFDLAPGGVYLAASHYCFARWSLTPPFHPYRINPAVCFLRHFPSAQFARALPSITPGHLALWSPDFPPAVSSFLWRPATRPSPGRHKTKVSIQFAHKNRKPRSSFLPGHLPTWHS